MKNSEGKRFVVIEDRLEWQAEIRTALEESGHKVVGRAVTLGAAIELVKKFKKLKVDAVTLDANLCDELVDGRRAGDDGRDILKEIRRLAPTVKVIGMSMDSMKDVDFDIGKPGRTKQSLEYAISQLFAKK